jgi:hypothetical protein
MLFILDVFSSPPVRDACRQPSSVAERARFPTPRKALRRPHTHLRSLSNIMLPLHPSTASAYVLLGELMRSTRRCNRFVMLPGLGGSRNSTNALSRPSKLLCTGTWCEEEVISGNEIDQDTAEEQSTVHHPNEDAAETTRRRTYVAHVL